MTFNYGKFQKLAQSNIEKYGASAALRRETVSGGMAWEAGSVQVKDYPVVVLIGSFKERLIDGTNIRYGDRKILIPVEKLIFDGERITPTTDDKIVIDDIEYLIVNVNPVCPGGVDLIFEVQARGSALPGVR